MLASPASSRHRPLSLSPALPSCCSISLLILTGVCDLFAWYVVMASNMQEFKLRRWTIRNRLYSPWVMRHAYRIRVVVAGLVTLVLSIVSAAAQLPYAMATRSGAVAACPCRLGAAGAVSHCLHALQGALLAAPLRKADCVLALQLCAASLASCQPSIWLFLR